MREQSVDVVKGVYAAFSQGDVPGVLDAFADQIEWHEAEGMPYGGLHRGGEAVAKNVFGPISEDVEDFAVTPEEFMASGESVAVVARYTGTGKATGKSLDQTAVHVWDTEGDKVVRFRHFMDTVMFAEVVPAADSVAES